MRHFRKGFFGALAIASAALAPHCFAQSGLGVTDTKAAPPQNGIVTGPLGQDFYAGGNNVMQTRMGGVFMENLSAAVVAEGTTIARTLQDRFAEKCNVLDFGAKNDGVTDDTASWQKAINACASKGGGTVIAPPGNSVVGKLVLPSYIALIGSGIYTTVITPVNSSDDTFTFSDGAHYDEISGIRFNGLNNHRTGGAVFHVCGTCGTMYFHNVSTYFAFKTLQVDGDGTDFGGATEIIVDVGDFRNTQSGSAMAEIDGGNDTFFSHITGDNDRNAVAPYAGFRVNRTGGFWLTQSDIINFNHGMSINGSVNTKWGFISETAFDTSAGDGIEIVAPSGTSVVGWDFLGVWISSSNPGNGVGTYGSGTIDSITFHDARILNNYYDGININIGTNISITDSLIVGDGGATTAQNPYYDVRLAGGSTVGDISILNNKMGTAAGYPTYACGAIYVYDETSATNLSDHLMILGNNLRGTSCGFGIHLTTGDRLHVINHNNMGDDGDN